MPEISPPPRYVGYPRNPESKRSDTPAHLYALGEGCLDLEIVPFFPACVIAIIILGRGWPREPIVQVTFALCMVLTWFFNYLAASSICYGLRWKRITAPLLLFLVGGAMTFFAMLSLPGAASATCIAIVQIGFFVVMRRLAAHELRRHGLQLRGLFNRRRSFRKDFEAYLEANSDSSMANPPSSSTLSEVG